MKPLPATLSKLTKPLGIALMALSAIAWIAVFVIPFLELSGLQIAGVITGLIIFAEICFYIAIILLGKPLWNKFKHNLLDMMNKAKEK